MTTVAEHIYNIINTGVVVLGGRIYPNKLLQDTPLPAARYFRVSTPEHNSAMGSDTGVVNAMYQVDVYGLQFNDDTDGADQVSTLVKAALQRYKGTFTGQEILSIFIRDVSDDFDSSTTLTSVRIDIEVIFRE